MVKSEFPLFYKGILVFEIMESREKKQDFIYQLEKSMAEMDEIKLFMHICREIPEAFIYAELLKAEIIIDGKSFQSEYFEKSTRFISSKISSNASISLYYLNNNKAVFDKADQAFLDYIALRLSHFLQDKTKGEEKKKKIENDYHSKWRREIAEDLCRQTDFQELGIKNIYLIGSVKNNTAASSSDIDLIVLHKEKQPSEKLKCWFEVWNKAIYAMLKLINRENLQEEILDIHYLSEHEDKTQNSYATMISSVNNTAKLLKGEKDD